MKLVTWNIAGRAEAWRYLLDIDADLALLQEATEPPPDIANKFEMNPAPWRTVGAGKNRPWRAALVNLSKQFDMNHLEAKSIASANPGELAVSRVGTLAAGTLTLPSGEDLVVVSVYAAWENPHHSTGSSSIYADASVHRIISNLSVFIGQRAGHRIIVAGDFNILVRLRREWEPVLGIPIRIRIRPDVGTGAGVCRSPGSSRPVGGTLAGRTSGYQQKRSNLPHQSTDTNYGDKTTRFCIRLE